MQWQTVIGLEVHIQLATRSKLFSTSPTTYGAPANTQTSFIDAGLPGVLPVLNEAAVDMAIQFGLAIQATINNYSYFERKNYFYPDLPKGYQISQFQCPIVSEGYLDIPSGAGTKRVNIARAHLEEDAGKSLHEMYSNYTGIDLNRAGTPLLEIVTTPCLYSAEEAVLYLKTLHQLVRFLGICDGNMQEGSFRCDVNLSLRPLGSEQLGTRTELKNLNSFRFIEKAIQYESMRHQDCLELGQPLTQETRLYSPEKNCTEVLRSKEDENDYRYFPDPDLLPIFISPEKLETLKSQLPALPAAIRAELATDALSADEIDFLLTSPALYYFFAETRKLTKASTKTIVNWLKGPHSAILHEQDKTFTTPLLTAKELSLLLDALSENKITLKLAKTIFLQLQEGKDSMVALLKQHEMKPLDDSEIVALIQKILQENPAQVADYRAGKEKLFAFFIGQVMRNMKGADPNRVNTLLRQLLHR